MKLNDPLIDKVLPPKLSKGEKRKRIVVRSALQVLSKMGAEGFNYNAIGKAAGISRALVAHYFPNKRDILKTCVQVIVLEAQEATIKKLKSAQSLEDAMYAFVDAALDTFYKSPGYYSIFLLLYHYCTVDSEIRKFHLDFREMGARRIAKSLELFSTPSAKNSSLLLAREIQDCVMNLAIANILSIRPLGQRSIKTKIRNEVMELVNQSK